MQFEALASANRRLVLDQELLPPDEAFLLEKGITTLEGDSSLKTSQGVGLEKVEHRTCLGQRMHPVFTDTADDWMFPDETPGASSSATPPAIPLDESPPGESIILKEPDAVDLDPVDSQPSKVERRVRGKSTDPVTAAALKKIHDKLRCKKELHKLHLKHYHMKLDA